MWLAFAATRGFGMKEKRRVDRRTVVALLAGVGVTIVGCGSDDDPASATRVPEVGEISENHGHSAQIREPQLAAAHALDLDIQGTANHTHMLRLTNDEVRRIRDGERVGKISSLTSSHSHTVTFN
jgi:hypothetical protein